MDSHDPWQAHTTSPNQTTWADLRVWIATREAIEGQTGVSTLRADQKRVIRELLDSEIETPNHRVLEMEADSKNYVGDLSELILKKKLGQPPSFSDGEMVDPQVPNAPNNWTVTCTLPWCGETFPQPGYGCESGGKPPGFQGKKLAKQYAAKHALAYIVDYIEAPDQAAAAARPPSSASSHASSQKHARSGSLSQPSPAPKRAALRREHDPRYQASLLCARLNVPPPQILVGRADPDGHPDLFKGMVRWPAGITPPDAPITIDGALFRDQQEAEEYLARRALEWLQAEAQRRGGVDDPLTLALRGQEERTGRSEAGERIPGLGLAAY